MEHICFDEKANFNCDQMIKNMSLLSGMAVTLYNSHRMWIASYPSSRYEYCKVLRYNETCRDRCQNSDREAFDICSKTGKAYAYRCHGGLYEIIVPLYNQDAICGYLMLGQVLGDDRESLKRYIDRHVSENVSGCLLEEAANKTPCISAERLQAVIQMAVIYSEYIFAKDLMKDEINSLPNQVALYITEHLGSKITNAGLCSIFLCDRRKLTSEFRRVYGMTITDYVNNARLRKAREMFKNNPSFSIGYVSRKSGFTSQSYFGKLFLKKYGITPTEMQKKYDQKHSLESL